MPYSLSVPESARQLGFVKRFDALFWSVNFPRPMMASVVTTGPDSLRVDAVFYKANDLAGLIWEAEDRFDHPLLAYETSRDFRGCVLRFRWRSGGVLPLDALNGPTLTIEGRDAGGKPRSWFVRLWNYAEGTPEDALVTLDFSVLDGGFALPDEADPVWADDVDRMFISLAPPGYVEEDESPLAAPAEGWAELSGIACDGAGSVLAIGETLVPEHSLRIATGYDDLYNLTPARVLRNALGLGYRGVIDHYVGMSHYFRLEANSGGFYVSLAGSALNVACAAWHRDFMGRANGLGYEVIASLSYELLDAHCWNDWKQRAEDGSPALTGWVPPSTLLSPAHDGAMGYLRAVARAFAAIARDSGLKVRFQIGEPWWWVMPDGRICLYDAAAVAAFAPVSIPNVRAALDGSQTATLDAAGQVLAESTAALRDAVRQEAPGAEVLLLVYLPTVLDGAETSALPAALGAEAAKALAEYRLAALQAGRGTGKIGLGWRRSDLRPGDRLRLDVQGGTWRVGKWLLEKMVLRLDLVRVPGRELAAAASASPGRPVTEPDLPFGPTTALLLDLPLHDGDLPGRPRLFALAAGAGAGWRRAELMTSHDGGASWQAAGGSAPGAVIGTALGVLPPGGSALIDTKNSIEIELLNDEMWLEGRSDDALVAGANLAAMGDELIQFGVAEPLGDRRFRLSRLLRGRRGTEWAASSHEAGEAFALIDPASMMAVEPPLAALGGEARLLAQGPGDEESVTTSRPISGEALRPPSPVHLTAERLANGDIAINWTRRSRSGWAWIDGLDAPLGEEREAYSLTIRSGGATRSVSVDRPSWVYSAADQLGDGAAGPFTINVAQIGTWAPSHPAEIGFEQEEI